MRYELFERNANKAGSLIIAVVPGEGRVILNAAASRLLEQAKVQAVQVLWDREAHMLALKGTKKTDSNAFAVSGRKARHMASISMKSFFQWIGWIADKRVSLPAKWNRSKKMLEVQVSAEYLGATHAGRRRSKKAVSQNI